MYAIPSFCRSQAFFSIQEELHVHTCTCTFVFINKLLRYKILLAFYIKWQNLKFARKGPLKCCSHLIKSY